MVSIRVIGCWCLVAVSGGCLGPARVSTQVYGRADVPLKDTEPLLKTVVDPGGEGCGKIAVIDVDGLLINANLTGLYSAGENPVEMFREKLDDVARDPAFRAVVVRINSPGGGVTASDIMWRDLESFKSKTGLPVVACLMDVATGGAYYVATGADEIYAHPATITGGIGVILNRYSLQDLIEKVSASYRPIKSGKYADLGTPLTPLDEEGQQVLQDAARKFHLRFQNLVRQSRPLRNISLDAPHSSDSVTPPEGAPLEAIKTAPIAVWNSQEEREYEEFPQWCDGRVFTAQKALHIGLVDHIGYLDDAIDAARARGNCPRASVVVLHRRKDPARTAYAITPNSRSAIGVLNISVPSIERSRQPMFMYLWLVEPTLDSWTGR